MSDQMIVDNCSPTLAGLKTGSLFSVRFRNPEKLIAEIRELNRLLVRKQLRAVPLRIREGLALIYVYRPDRLELDLSDPEAAGMLRSLGYAADSANGAVAELAARMARTAEFPHEIGLFLGYPPEDVKGFMRDPLHGYKYIGCWKVYGNVERARKLFDRYTRCTDIYRRCLTRGTPLDRLIVGRV